MQLGSGCHTKKTNKWSFILIIYLKVFVRIIECYHEPANPNEILLIQQPRNWSMWSTPEGAVMTHSIKTLAVKPSRMMTKQESHEQYSFFKQKQQEVKQWRQMKLIWYIHSYHIFYSSFSKVLFMEQQQQPSSKAHHHPHSPCLSPTSFKSSRLIPQPAPKNNKAIGIQENTTTQQHKEHCDGGEKTGSNQDLASMLESYKTLHKSWSCLHFEVEILSNRPLEIESRV